MKRLRVIKEMWLFLVRELPEAFMDGYDPTRKRRTYQGYADAGRDR